MFDENGTKTAKLARLNNEPALEQRYSFAEQYTGPTSAIERSANDIHVTPKTDYSSVQPSEHYHNDVGCGSVLFRVDLSTSLVDVSVLNARSSPSKEATPLKPFLARFGAPQNEVIIEQEHARTEELSIGADACSLSKIEAVEKAEIAVAACDDVSRQQEKLQEGAQIAENFLSFDGWERLRASLAAEADLEQEPADPHVKIRSILKKELLEKFGAVAAAGRQEISQLREKISSMVRREELERSRAVAAALEDETCQLRERIRSLLASKEELDKAAVVLETNEEEVLHLRQVVSRLKAKESLENAKAAVAAHNKEMAQLRELVDTMVNNELPDEKKTSSGTQLLTEGGTKSSIATEETNRQVTLQHGEMLLRTPFHGKSTALTAALGEESYQPREEMIRKEELDKATAALAVHGKEIARLRARASLVMKAQLDKALAVAAEHEQESVQLRKQLTCMVRREELEKSIAMTAALENEVFHLREQLSPMVWKEELDKATAALAVNEKEILQLRSQLLAMTKSEVFQKALASVAAQGKDISLLGQQASSVMKGLLEKARAVAAAHSLETEQLKAQLSTMVQREELEACMAATTALEKEVAQLRAQLSCTVKKERLDKAMADCTAREQEAALLREQLSNMVKREERLISSLGDECMHLRQQVSSMVRELLDKARVAAIAYEQASAYLREEFSSMVTREELERWIDRAGALEEENKLLREQQSQMRSTPLESLTRSLPPYFDHPQHCRPTALFPLPPMHPKEPTAHSDMAEKPCDQ